MLALAAFEYSDAHHGKLNLPAAVQVNSFPGNRFQPTRLYCPSDPNHTPYSFNTDVAKVNFDRLRAFDDRVVLFYEGKNRVLSFRHNGYACVAFASGAVNLVSPSEATRLHWSVNDAMINKGIEAQKREDIAAAKRDKEYQAKRSLQEQANRILDQKARKRDLAKSQALKNAQAKVAKLFPYKGMWTAHIDNNDIALEIQQSGRVSFKPFGRSWTAVVAGKQLIITCYDPPKTNDATGRTNIIRLTPHAGGAKMQVEEKYYAANKWLEAGSYILTRQWSD